MGFVTCSYITVLIKVEMGVVFIILVTKYKVENLWGNMTLIPHPLKPPKMNRSFLQ